MTRTLALRTLGVLAGLLALSLATFTMIRLIPGEVDDVMLGTENVSEETRQAFRDRYGLDDPLPAQYAAWIGGVVQ
ncbi:MAG TPA: hypothetical protein VIR30_04230, partial [Nocardioides sp.]